MSIKIEPLEQMHILDIAERMMERHALIAVAMKANPGYAAMLRAAGPAFAYVIDGVVMAVIGFVDFGPSERCYVWCTFAADSGRYFGALVRCVMRTMKAIPRRRYEAYVDPTFDAGKRLVNIAGFKYEGLMHKFEADGSDRELWALVGG